MARGRGAAAPPRPRRLGRGAPGGESGAVAMMQDGLLRVIDWFVPEELRTNTGSFWQARIFAISHLFGPCLAVVILVYLYLADPDPGLPYYTICVFAFAFWLLP